MNSCVTLFDIRYYTDIFIMSLCKPLCWILGQPTGVGTVHISRQKPQSSQSTQTLVDWNSTSFWQSLRLQTIWLLNHFCSWQSGCAVQPSTSFRLPQLMQICTSSGNGSASDPINARIPCFPLLNTKQADTLMLSTLEKHHVLSQNSSRPWRPGI